MDRLGIIDWGIGGIGILKLLRRRSPSIDITYFSDTGVTPYGRMSRRELIARLDRVTGFLIRRGITHILIGCNAASTVIDETATYGTKVIGTIEPAISQTTDLRPTRLGLIGGRRTVLSAVYIVGFAENGISVKQRIAQPLSAYIESGDVTSPLLRSEAQRILRPLRNCSHILLACTHYPAIQPMLAEFVSPKTTFIDPATELVDIVTGWDLSGTGESEYLTTGDAYAMKRAAHIAFGFGVDTPQTVTI